MKANRLAEYDVLARIDTVTDAVPGASAVDIAQEIAEDIPDAIVRGALAYALVAVVNARQHQRFRTLEVQNGHRSIYDRRGAISATCFKRLGDWSRHDVQTRGEFLHQLALEAKAADHQAERLLDTMVRAGATRVDDVAAADLAVVLDGAA